MNLDEKLNYLINANVDPRRSQIHPYINENILRIFIENGWLEKYQTAYYDDIAKLIKYRITEHCDDINFYKKIIEGMFQDTLNGYWGMVIDW